MKPKAFCYAEYEKLQEENDRLHKLLDQKCDDCACNILNERDYLLKAIADLKDSGFCLSCKGCYAPHNPDDIRWCNDWNWCGSKN